MTRADEPDDVGDLDRCAAPGLREPPHASARSSAPVDSTSACSAAACNATADGELAQDALGLLARLRRRLGQAVVQLDDGERLDEERLPGARRVVDDPRHLRTSGRANREHRPAPALGEERLLQRVVHTARARDARELVAEARAAVAQLGAQLAQQRRGACRADRSRPPRSGGRSRRRAARGPGRRGSQERSEHRFVQDAPRLESDAHRDRDRAQLVGPEEPAAARPLGGRRTSRMPASSGAVSAVEHATAADGQLAGARSTVARSADGASARASAAPRSVEAKVARRSRIAGSSSAASAAASITRQCRRSEPPRRYSGRSSPGRSR